MRKTICMLLVILLIAAQVCMAENAEITLSNSGESWTAQLFAMDTFMQATIYEPSLSADEVTGIMQNITRLESIFSATDSKSEISAVNSAGGGMVEISADTFAAIKTAVEVSAETGGAFDITAYPLVKAWGFTQAEYRVPDADELAELLALTGYEKLVLTGNTLSVEARTEIDLGGIAKGYTGDVLTNELREKGVESALISLGGNIALVGCKPDGSLWKVGIRDPLNTADNIGYVQVEDTNVITSGGYERYFEDADGNIWWHIIDPATGYPAKNGLLSVTVIGKNGAKCDALSTALFVMGPEAASEYLAGQNEVDAVLVCEDGRLLITQGLNGRFVPLGRYTKQSVYWIGQ